MPAILTHSTVKQWPRPCSGHFKWYPPNPVCSRYVTDARKPHALRGVTTPILQMRKRGLTQGLCNVVSKWILTQSVGSCAALPLTTCVPRSARACLSPTISPGRGLLSHPPVTHEETPEGSHLPTALDGWPRPIEASVGALRSRTWVYLSPSIPCLLSPPLCSSCFVYFYQRTSWSRGWEVAGREEGGVLSWLGRLAPSRVTNS